MRTEKIIRSQAKQSLKGNWTSAVACVLILLSTILVLELFYELLCELSGVFSDDKLNSGSEIPLIIILCLTLLLTFAVSPFKNGYLKLCYNIACGRSGGLRDIFYFFSGIKIYFKTLRFNFLLLLKKILYALISFLPYIFYRISTVLLTQGKADNTLSDILGIILICVGIAFTLIFSIRLLITDFVFVDNHEANVFGIAKAISKKHLRSYYKLVFTFILWILSCFFVLPVLYVIPYFTTSLGTTSKWLINLYKEGKTV